MRIIVLCSSECGVPVQLTPAKLQLPAGKMVLTTCDNNLVREGYVMVLSEALSFLRNRNIAKLLRLRTLFDKKAVYSRLFSSGASIEFT